MTTGLLQHPRFLDHDTGYGHPERPARLREIDDALRGEGLLDRLTPLEFEPAPLDAITAIHSPAYVQRVEDACHAGERYIDMPDVAVCPESAEIAWLAAGGAIAAVDSVITGRVDHALCLSRPPGHHAEADTAMGFCLFNHIAIAAQHLINHHGLERVAIFDFDVHHGNGTQHAFEDRADVLYLSTHQDPDTLFPGTGRERETGRGAGAGYTRNIPLPPGTADELYMDAVRERVIPALAEYCPQVILLSAGFDGCAADPLAQLELSPDVFGPLTEVVMAVAADCCDGRVVSILEGGYHLESLGRAISAHVAALIQ